MSKLERYRNTEGKIWINVASSVYVEEGFLNLDNNVFLRYLGFFNLIKPLVPKRYHYFIDEYNQARSKAPLERHNCIKPLFFPDNSVDHILCSHFLEHVFPAEAEQIISDFYRVLKPGGTLHIIVPDIRVQVDQYLNQSQKGDEEAADHFIESTLLSRNARGSWRYRIMEFLGAFGLQHYWMYDHASMRKRVVQAKFTVLEKNSTPSKHCRMNDDSVHIVASK